MTIDEVARERATAAHLRLDGINGQIVAVRHSIDETREGLREELAETREGIYAETGKLHDRQNETNIELAKVKTRAGIMAAVGAAIATCVLAPVMVYLLVAVLHLNPSPSGPEPSPRAAVRAAR